MRIKLVVAGSNSVVKRNLLINFKEQKIVKDYIPVVIDNFTHIENIDDKNHHAVIWDTSGAENYYQTRQLGYRGANAFLLVYSDLESVGDILSHHEEISRACPRAAVMLVSVDRHEQDTAKVTPEIGRGLATYLRIPFLQCAIENLDEINLMFKFAVRHGVEAARQIKIQQGLQLWHDPIPASEPQAQKSYQTGSRLTRSL